MFLETLGEFLVKHGCFGASGERPLRETSEDGSRVTWLAPDGAKVVEATMGGTTFEEPPDNLHARLWRQRYFHRCRRDWAKSCFDSLKNALAGIGSFKWTRDHEETFGAAPPEGKDALVLIKRYHDKHAKVFRKLTQEFENTPEEVAERARRVAAEKARQLDSEFKARRSAEIAAIELAEVE